MAEQISQGVSPVTGNQDPIATDSSDERVFQNMLNDAIEQIKDPDGIKITGGVTSNVGEASFNIGINERDGITGGVDAEIADETSLGSDPDGPSIGGKVGVGKDGTEIKTKVAGREAVGTVRRDDDGTLEISLEVDLTKGEKKSVSGEIVGGLTNTAKNFLRGPAGVLTDVEPKFVLNQRITPEGEITTSTGMKLEASPSKAVEFLTPIEKLDPKAFVQVEGVFIDDDFAGFDVDLQDSIAASPPETPLDTHGILNPETRPGYIDTVELAPGASVMVTADGRMVAGMETVRPETALALESMVRGVTVADYEAKAEEASTDAKRIENQAIAGAIRDGASIREAKNLGVDVRAVQSYHGDTRNADALVEDSRDNGFIDGSNLPEAKIGHETYAISTGGGVMHGRTTMTPGELAARANARSADPDAVNSDEVAKAMADAMAQSLREGFSTRDQVAANDPTGAVPGEASAAIREQLEAIVDDENAAELAGRERKALEGLIDEARKIEEAAKFEGAKGLADNEYALAMQMMEKQALDDMITKAQELDALADVPIPTFKPDLPNPEPSDGPDMRGDKVAFGRGVVENGPSGKNTAYDSFSDWSADMRDMFGGNGPKEGVATPNEAEEKAAEKKQEGGENRGQQNDVPEAGSKENDAATSDEFDAMGKSTAGPDKDEKAEEKDEKKSSGQKHEGGENRGQQRDSDPQRDSNDVRDSGSF